MAGVKRRLSDQVYKQMVTDAKTARTGPGGHMGATLQSSAAGPIPTASSSDQSQPGPAKHQRRTPLAAIDTDLAVDVDVDQRDPAHHDAAHLHTAEPGIDYVAGTEFRAAQVDPLEREPARSTRSNRERLRSSPMKSATPRQLRHIPTSAPSPRMTVRLAAEAP
jgi:hypothetical protein